MTFGEKVRQARIALNLSQTELADKTGLSERSLYTYEQTNTMPRAGNIKKLAEALNVSVSYLLDEEESDNQKNIDQDLFLVNVKNEFGYRGAREATALLEKASALFAGGELDDEAKDVFFQSLMEVYLKSKAEAREKFTPKMRKSRKPQ
ncbi:helix-turn-helix domain-containing protein [Lachnospiraceae bacterium ZAX-1]